MRTFPSKVVIIGGGFAGLNAAKSLGEGPAEVIVIDKTNHHLFQPLLYQVASAALSPADIAAPIREILNHQKNTLVFLSEVCSIDKKRKLIHLLHAEPISFDYLIVAVGARHSYFGNPDWEKSAPGIKTLADALRIREKILMSFEIAERLNNPIESEKYLNFVVVGGGPTGVEVAGAIAEIAYKTMLKDYKRVNINKTKIFLVEATSQVLPGFHHKLCAAAKKDLEKLGVHVILNKRVTEVTEEGVQIEDHFLPAQNVIWAAGNEASPLLRTLGVPLDRQGRVIVEKDLTIPDYPNIFVIGDAACVLGKDGKPIPAIAPAALQEGRYVAGIIKNRIPKEKRPAFSYFDKGMMATIGRGKAVASVGPIAFSGFFAWLAWGFIHVLYLVGFKKRVLVVMEWFFFYITEKRAARLVSSHEDLLNAKRECSDVSD
jgi:NADH:ubiquinone reductase (H+-translocating)